MECRGCGTDYDSWTKGCNTCTNRHYHRALRSGSERVMAAYRRTAKEHIIEGAFAGAAANAQKWANGYRFPFWEYS